MNAPRDPRLTVAIPTCNGARHLAETLRGVLAQGGRFPLLLSDDRSDDATLDIARAIAGDRLRIVINAERLGLAGNWNRCVAIANTPLVAIIHQDDVWRPGHLDAHLAAYEADRVVGWIASASGVIDDAGREVPAATVDRGGLGDRDRRFPPGGAVRELAVSNPLRCSAVTIAKAAHAEVGGFDPSYRYVVDWDFWLRVARQFAVAWVARPTVDVRWHLASETHRFATGLSDLEETSRLLDVLFETANAPIGPDTPGLRRDADRRLARAYLNRAHVALRAADATLARSALDRAFALDRGLAGRIALDPRLAVQMMALAVAPRWAARVFGRMGDG